MIITNYGFHTTVCVNFIFPIFPSGYKLQGYVITSKFNSQPVTMESITVSKYPGNKKNSHTNSTTLALRIVQTVKLDLLVTVHLNIPIFTPGVNTTYNFSINSLNVQNSQKETHRILCTINNIIIYITTHCTNAINYVSQK